MSTLSQFFSGIKSIQRLTVSQTVSDLYSGWPATVTISSVDVNKTIILVNGQPGLLRINEYIMGISLPSVNLTSSTSISLAGTPSNVPGTINIQVVEFY